MIDDYKNKLLAYSSIIPSTLLITLLLQNRFSGLLSKTIFHRGLLFILWFAGSHYLVTHLVENKMQEKEFKELFKRLVQK